LDEMDWTKTGGWKQVGRKVGLPKGAPPSLGRPRRFCRCRRPSVLKYQKQMAGFDSWIVCKKYCKIRRILDTTRHISQFISRFEGTNPPSSSKFNLQCHKCWCLIYLIPSTIGPKSPPYVVILTHVLCTI